MVAIELSIGGPPVKQNEIKTFEKLTLGTVSNLMINKTGKSFSLKSYIHEITEYSSIVGSTYSYAKWMLDAYLVNPM